MPLGEPPSTALRPTAGDDVHARLTAARSSAAGFVTAFIAATQPPRASAGCSAEELAAYADRLEVVVRVWSELLLVVRPTAGALSAAENLLRALESP